jgi:hypothetical protein
MQAHEVLQNALALIAMPSSWLQSEFRYSFLTPDGQKVFAYCAVGAIYEVTDAVEDTDERFRLRCEAITPLAARLGHTHFSVLNEAESTVTQWNDRVQHQTVVRGFREAIQMTRPDKVASIPAVESDLAVAGD